ncbi:hypothetical protein SLS64_005909 [Diaporthe eres]
MPYFIGFEILKFISCMVFVGSEKTVTVSSNRKGLSPQPVTRPKFTGDRRSKQKRRLSDEIPLQEIHLDKLDIEKGPNHSEESWDYNEVINPDWEVDRRAGLYIVGWYGPDDPEVSPSEPKESQRAMLREQRDAEPPELVGSQEAVRNL